LILCWNVKIYFDLQTRNNLIGRVKPTLELGGHLIVGRSENLSGIRHSLQNLQPTIYLKPQTPKCRRIKLQAREHQACLTQI